MWGRGREEQVLNPAVQVVGWEKQLIRPRAKVHPLGPVSLSGFHGHSLPPSPQ